MSCGGEGVTKRKRKGWWDTGSDHAIPEHTTAESQRTSEWSPKHLGRKKSCLGTVNISLIFPGSQEDGRRFLSILGTTDSALVLYNL